MFAVVKMLEKFLFVKCGKHFAEDAEKVIVISWVGDRNSIGGKSLESIVAEVV
jgi:hypothetical protein